MTLVHTDVFTFVCSLAISEELWCMVMLLLVVIAYYAKEQMFGLSCALCKNLKIKFV